MTVTPDLTQLNPAEREILSLLAQGHTMKSIAAETGRTEGSVTERLREARRKTGLGSSRELARLLRVQEIGDMETGVAAGEEDRPAPGGVAIGPRRTTKVFSMMIVGGLTLLAAAFLLPVQDKSPAGDDPLFVAASGEAGTTPAMLRAKMSGEARDPVWAPASEALIRQHYLSIAGVDAGTLRVTCRATSCEVLGRSVGGASIDELKRAEGQLQTPVFRTIDANEGLHAYFTTTGSEDNPDAYRFKFLGYWRRVSR